MSDTFSALSSTDFEQFTFDILIHLGFKNVDWRRGTALAASPSDRGRDIEATVVRTELDGTTHPERWFVECKHYVQGVPAEALQGALAWATAERPEVLLFVASGFLSNACKDHLEAYTRNVAPTFRIKVWERPKLLEFLASAESLAIKYQLPGEMSFVESMHPAHLQFHRHLCMTPLEDLLGVLDTLDAGLRERALRTVFPALGGHRLHGMSFPNPPQSMAEVFTAVMTSNAWNYEDFKRDARALVLHGLNKRFLCGAIISTAAAYLFSGFDHSDDLRKRAEKDLFAEQASAAIKENRVASFVANNSFLRNLNQLYINGIEPDDLDRLIEIVRSPSRADALADRNSSDYVRFCREVIVPLNLRQHRSSLLST